MKLSLMFSLVPLLSLACGASAGQLAGTVSGDDASGGETNLDTGVDSSGENLDAGGTDSSEPSPDALEASADSSQTNSLDTGSTEDAPSCPQGCQQSPTHFQCLCPDASEECPKGCHPKQSATHFECECDDASCHDHR
jgi:hypothetical protein